MVDEDAHLRISPPALLQVSGRAENLFDDEASRVMPGASLVTLITIDEAFLTSGALDLELASGWACDLRFDLVAVVALSVAPP